MLSFKSLFVAIAVMSLAGCSALNDKAQQLADKGARYSVQRNVGKSYADVAAQRDFTLERNPIIGKLTGSQPLEDGRVIYFHQRRQESTGSESSLGILSRSEQHVRYDDFAYLVSAEGTIIDYAHKRRNSVYDQTEIGSGFLGLELADDEKKDKDVTEISDYVTSSGTSIRTWYQTAQSN